MQTYTTQMDAARKGIITPEMEIVAKKDAKRQPPDTGLPSAAILWFCIETQAIHLDGWMLKYS